jgi:hypothetical protein
MAASERADSQESISHGHLYGKTRLFENRFPVNAPMKGNNLETPEFRRNIGFLSKT